MSPWRCQSSEKMSLSNGGHLYQEASKKLLCCEYIASWKVLR
ncbi:hypothetical protein DFQ01_1411, partial [Paenibacillus cellulosilyticus]